MKVVYHFLIITILLFFSRKCYSQQTAKTGSRLTEYIVPVTLISYGLLCSGDHGFPSSKSVQEFRNNNAPSFQTTVDDYLVFTPALAVYSLDLLSTGNKNDALNQTIIFAKTSAFTLAVVYGLKYLTLENRPDGSSNHSFPSSHTAFAFAWATVLHEEFKNKNPWISVAGYTVAASVGSLRIANNEHWYNDVLVGAGIGILGTKLVYLTHQHKFSSNRLKKSALLPNIGNRYTGITWQHTF